VVGWVGPMMSDDTSTGVLYDRESKNSDEQ
jgi:hypothetical protein